MPNLLAFAKYVLHLVGISREETLFIILIVVIIVLLHGCGDMDVVRCIIGDYKKETMSHWQQL